MGSIHTTSPVLAHASFHVEHDEWSLSTVFLAVTRKLFTLVMFRMIYS